MILPYVRVVWTAFYLHLKRISVHNFAIVGLVLQPLLVALLAIYVLRDSEGFQAIYVVAGSTIAGLWTGTLFFSGFSIEAERWAGTLEEIIGSPTSLTATIVGKMLANMAVPLVSTLLGYSLAVFLFGYPLTIAHPWLFVVSLLLTVLALISLGLVIAPIMSLNIGVNVWVNALELPMYILGGFLFPISLLPTWTRPLSYLLSPYWAARALHLTSGGGGSLDDVFISWGLLVGFSVVYLLIATRLFRVLLRRARAEATLGLQ